MSIQVQEAAAVKGDYKSQYLDYYQCLIKLILEHVHWVYEVYGRKGLFVFKTLERIILLANTVRINSPLAVPSAWGVCVFTWNLSNHVDLSYFNSFKTNSNNYSISTCLLLMYPWKPWPSVIVTIKESLVPELVKVHFTCFFVIIKLFLQDFFKNFWAFYTWY